MLVELGCIEVRDVESEDRDGDVAAGGAEAAELLDVGDVVAAAADGFAAAFAQVFELGEAFDEGEGEEEEDAEATEPGGDGNSCGGRAGEDANGVEAGEDDDVDEDRAFEAEGVCERGDEIDDKPQKEVVRFDQVEELWRQRGYDVGREQRQSEGDSEKENDDDDAGESGEIS